MAIPVQFDVLWNNLPQWFQAKKVPPKRPQDPPTKEFPQIPGMEIPIAWETCCIQMSHALNKAGAKISYSNKNRVMRDRAGNEYMLDVKEMREYIAQKHGAPEIIDRVDSDKKPLPRWLVQSTLADRTGLLAFGNRHIDLWNGSRIHGEHYIPEALWEDVSTLRLGVFFWVI